MQRQLVVPKSRAIIYFSFVMKPASFQKTEKLLAASRHKTLYGYKFGRNITMPGT